MTKQERLLQSALAKLTRAKDFNSDAVLESDEANVVWIALQGAASILRKEADRKIRINNK